MSQRSALSLPGSISPSSATSPSTPTHDINETAAEKVFSNNLIMSEVYSWVPRGSAVNCLLVHKAGFVIAAKAVYKEVAQDIGVALSRLFCPPWRLDIYIKAVSSVRLGLPYTPTDITIQPLKEYFPHANKFTFHNSSGVTFNITRDAAQNFTELSYSVDSEGKLIDSHLTHDITGGVGEEPRLRLISLAVKRQGRHKDYDAMKIFGPRLMSEPGAVDRRPLEQVLEPLRSLELCGGVINEASFRAILQSTPNLTHLAIRIGRSDMNSLHRVIRTHCRSLRHLTVFSNPYRRRLPCLHRLTRGRQGIPLISFTTQSGMHDAAEAAKTRALDWQQLGSGPPELDRGMASACRYRCYSTLAEVRVEYWPESQSFPDPLAFAHMTRGYFSGKTDLHLEVGAGVSKVGMSELAKAWAKNVMAYRLMLLHLGPGAGQRLGWSQRLKQNLVIADAHIGDNAGHDQDEVERGNASPVVISSDDREEEEL